MGTSGDFEAGLETCLGIIDLKRERVCVCSGLRVYMMAAGDSMKWSKNLCLESFEAGIYMEKNLCEMSGWLFSRQFDCNLLIARIETSSRCILHMSPWPFGIWSF